MGKLFVAGVLVSLFASTADARTRFETYEARNAFREGQGGSKTVKDGIDFWTLGDPPRRYQIIGVIRDNRGTGALFGNAVGSSGIAKMVREAGGDAVVLVEQNTGLKGVWSQGQVSTFGNQAFGSGMAIPIRERVTTFAVVKYLPDEPTGAPSLAPPPSP